MPSGDGVKDEDIVLRFEPVVALVQSKEQRQLSEAICFFTFLGTGGPTDYLILEESADSSTEVSSASWRLLS